ncbi:hypothetical protein [Flavobacterium oreochromis]|uniref:hypothetical protein n=1 Tax=Flavobacterium oreochromis TaxID=2906078 RepID=UPI003859E65D
MANFQVDNKSVILILASFLFFSCSSSLIKSNKNINSSQWIVLDLKNSQIRFSKKDVLGNISKESLKDERIKKIYEKVEITQDSILIAKDFFYENVIVNENEALNFALLNEVMLYLIKNGKFKVFDKQKSNFVNEIILKKFKPKLGSFGYDLFYLDKTRIYTISIGISN